MFKIIVVCWLVIFSTLKYLDFIPEYSWWWLLGVPVAVWLVFLVIAVLLILLAFLICKRQGRVQEFKRRLKAEVLK